MSDTSRLGLTQGGEIDAGGRTPFATKGVASAVAAHDFATLELAILRALQQLL
ncbi:hypothetical protein [Cryobacterium sp. M91]|uniref:hypothetical protein n=1 Tax=Cryobacterium sp. M91 TaxID=2048294 RepID=UPI001305021F|nr:hypothetical protein [Cryobacterium sp. M91]